MCVCVCVKDFIYLFLEKGEGRETETERNISVCLPLVHPLLGTWPATQAHALTGNRISDTLVLRPALNPVSRTSQGEACALIAKRFCCALWDNGNKDAVPLRGY